MACVRATAPEKVVHALKVQCNTGFIPFSSKHSLDSERPNLKNAGILERPYLKISYVRKEFLNVFHFHPGFLLFAGKGNRTGRELLVSKLMKEMYRSW